MSRIRGKDTTIEVALRKAIYAAGMRGYRVRSKIPGRPDIYFPRLKLAVFVDGCFWHKCPKCFRKPKSNKKYWDKKIAENVVRDRRVDARLQRLGVRRMRIWEHRIRQNLPVVVGRLIRKCAALGSPAEIG